MTERRRLILAVGNFDGVHMGHRSLLQSLVREGEARGLVPAVLTFTDHPLALIAPQKAPARLMSSQRRRHALQRCGVAEVIEVDFTPELRSLTARQFMAMIHDRYGVDALLLGFNNRIGSDRIDRFEDYLSIGRELGIEVIPAGDGIRDERPETRDERQETRVQSPESKEQREDTDLSGNFVSSTAIRAALASGDVTAASRMLGDRYTICGTVVAGRHLGTSIGFPTANVAPDDPAQMLPADGVYSADVTIGDDTTHYRAVVNIGTRPTVAGRHRTIEAHLIDFDRDIYGSTIAVAFDTRLRDERRFPSLDALVAQIRADIAAATHPEP